MAEEQKKSIPSNADPQGHKHSSQGEEAGAKDLLNLWGGAPAVGSKPKPVTDISDRPVTMLEKKHTPPENQAVREPQKKAASPDALPWLEKHETSKKIVEEKPNALEGEVLETKQKITEPAEKHDISEPESLEEKVSFGDQLDEFLAELNISRRQLISVFIVIVFVAGAVYIGLKGYKYYKSRRILETSQKSPTRIEERTTGIESATEIGQVIFPGHVAVGDTGISHITTIGAAPEVSNALAIYILTFRRLQNAYTTDINQLLDQGADRRSRLRSHLALLQKLYDEGTEIVKKLNTTLESVRVQYDSARQSQQTLDVNFFEQMDTLNALTAQDILDQFITVSKEVVEHRARFKAMQKIKSFFDQGLPKVKALSNDIKLNEEALVAGIKVYDVSGSDLSIIRRVENGARITPPPGPSPGSAFPLLPVHPSQVGGTRDFITQPGGGFADIKPKDNKKAGVKDHVITPGGGF